MANCCEQQRFWRVAKTLVHELDIIFFRCTMVQVGSDLTRGVNHAGADWQLMLSIKGGPRGYAAEH